jgi:hypothetical protein
LRLHLHMTSLLVTLVAGLALFAACSGGDDGATPSPTATPGPTATVAPGATPSPTATLAPGETPSPTATGTPTTPPEPVGDLPDGALLALSPASGTSVDSDAVLIRGTVESAAKVFINGEETESDSSGDFLAPVAIASGSNIIRVEVVAADGTRVTRELAVTGGN